MLHPLHSGLLLQTLHSVFFALSLSVAITWYLPFVVSSLRTIEVEAGKVRSVSIVQQVRSSSSMSAIIVQMEFSFTPLEI